MADFLGIGGAAEASFAANSDFLGRGGGGVLAVSPSISVSCGVGGKGRCLLGPVVGEGVGLGLLYTESLPLVLNWDTVLDLTGFLWFEGTCGRGRLGLPGDNSGDSNRGVCDVNDDERCFLGIGGAMFSLVRVPPLSSSLLLLSVSAPKLSLVLWSSG